MANKGKDTNGSQFFITMDDIPDLNGKYTIIGQVLNGFDSLLNLTKECGSKDGTAKCDAKITKTGIYQYDEYMKNKGKKLL
jgi:peptidyl-prolyl cis-trans isomerase A (cyclophilin A)